MFYQLGAANIITANSFPAGSGTPGRTMKRPDTMILFCRFPSLLRVGGRQLGLQRT